MQTGPWPSTGEVEVIQVIKTRLLRRGNGKTDPIRVIEQYWDMTGKLLWEYDPLDKVNEA